MFVSQVKEHLAKKQLPQESLLLVNNAPTHPIGELKSDDGKLTCLFLPANTTSIIQPMDQGIIENMKCGYRKDFIKSLLSFDDALTVKAFWKSCKKMIIGRAVKDAIFNIASAWVDLKESNLENE